MATEEANATHWVLYRRYPDHARTFNATAGYYFTHRASFVGSDSPNLVLSVTGHVKTIQTTHVEISYSTIGYRETCNDYLDPLHFFLALEDLEVLSATCTPYWAEYAGVTLHVIRVTAGTLATDWQRASYVVVESSTGLVVEGRVEASNGTIAVNLTTYLRFADQQYEEQVFWDRAAPWLIAGLVCGGIASAVLWYRRARRRTLIPGAATLH
jgi:hypothetical protein